MEVVLSQDGKTAMLYNPYIDKTFNLYHSEGKVLDLVIFFMLPSPRHDITYESYMRSTEDTVSIPFEMLDAA
jgi:hypothetical protein